MDVSVLESRQQRPAGQVNDLCRRPGQIPDPLVTRRRHRDDLAAADRDSACPLADRDQAAPGRVGGVHRTPGKDQVGLHGSALRSSREI